MHQLFKSTIVKVLAIAVLLLVLTVAALPWLVGGDHAIARVPAGPNWCSFEVRVDNFNEVVTVLKYRVLVDEHTITSSLAYPIAHVPIGSHLDERDFIVYFDKGAQLSALALRSRPDAVLAMYDFSTGETWPWRAPMESDGHRQERGAQMLAKLKGSSGLPPQLHLEGDEAK